MKRIKVLFLISFFSIPFLVTSQIKPSETGGSQGNYITTAVPFLNIAPESRGGGLGNTGAATSSDANSMYYNPAKYAFSDQSFGATMSYTPWLKQLVPDINLFYLAGFYKIDKMQTISTSLRYFSLGSIQLTDASNTMTTTANPNEFAFDVAYSRLLGKKFSGAVAMRFIRSDLFNGVGQEGIPVHAANSFAADVAFAYVNKTTVGGLKTVISGGINLSNMGAKISYDDLTKEFLPANLRLGGAYKVAVDQYNSLALSIDLNKLMVPTPDTSLTPSQYNELYKDMGVPKSIISSFSDAPGGFNEEMQEISVSAGLEYWYNNIFAGRLGYFHENENKGNRKFFTAGAGLKFNMFQIDASYIIPVNQNNPLANTIRFTLSFDLSQYNSGKKL